MNLSGITKNKWLVIMIIIAIILIIIMLYKKNSLVENEGFEQSAPFVLKRNNDIYDSYYAMIYDDIYQPQPRTEFEFKQIIDMTQSDQNNSVFLDIGCGTGNLVNKLAIEGYNAYGIDVSEAMINVAQQKYPDIEAKHGNVLDSMSYDRGTFTHITCMNFTLYHFENKLVFFRNCYYWLAPNGYIILHLVNREKYNPIVPIAVPSIIDNPQKYSDKRITDAVVQFPGFSYKDSTNFLQNKNANDNRVIVTETFKDSTTTNIRQNELTLYMENIKDVLYIAQKCGFILQGNISYKNDEHQYIYILERQE
jgi:SAM-dependent methyltransferase